ncbi:MAG: hypothetical protein LBL37_08545 [Gracilibacteraceae bacterium]|nr:hypothetical protein [Gracilibacteraceae bacterium]
MANTETKDALWFVTEQACCLAQATGRYTDDFRVCRATAEYLTNGDTDALARFDEITNAVKRDETGLEDFDTVEYEGKADDVRVVVTRLANFGLDLTAPEDWRAAFMKAADLVASFYGADDALDAALGRA